MPSLPFFVVALLPLLCHSSPINRQVGLTDNVFMTTQNDTNGLEHRVCSIDAITYSDGETIPTSSPCEHCVCRPPGFACTITSCEYRPGCKAFRRSDQCCPEYQCECEKDGKIYQNGEKIMDNNNPCEVCYCQGGEIICAVIDCYWRNDCAPRYIDNRCCPMYDHCPPPSAQGPIRHRLPQVPSMQAPITWHNLTMLTSSELPPVSSTIFASSELPTEAPSTTVSTTLPTTTTTSEAAPSSSSVDSVSLNEIAPQQDAIVPDNEPVHVTHDISESSPVAPVEAIQQGLLNEGLKAEPEVVGEQTAENEPQPPSTEQPAPSSVSSTVIDSTTLIIPAALELTVIQPTSVRPVIEILSLATISSNDEPLSLTNQPIELELNNDLATDAPPAAQNIQQDDSLDDAVTTESVLNSVAVSDSNVNELNQADSNQDPSGLRNEAENASDSPIINDEVVTTSAPAVINEINHYSEDSLNGVVRNDLPEASTQSDLQASEDFVTTQGPAAGESHNDIYSDGVEGTTPRLILDDDEIHNDEEASVPEVTEPAPFKQSDDSPIETATSEAILNDEPAAVTESRLSLANDHSSPEVYNDATEPSQQSDATESPSVNDISDDIQILHDDIENIPITQDATERVSIVQDATEGVSILQDDVEIASLIQDATEGSSVVQDSTGIVSILQDAAADNAPVVPDATESASVVQDDIEDVQNDATEGYPIARDEENAPLVQAATERVQIVQDATEGSQVVQDDESALFDEDAATEGLQILQDATERIQIVRDEESAPFVQDVTEVNPIVRDEENAPLVQDATETVQIVQDATQGSQVVQDDESALFDQDVTEGSPVAQQDENTLLQDATEGTLFVRDEENAPLVQDATERVQVLQDATEGPQAVQDDESALFDQDDTENLQDATVEPQILQDATEQTSIVQDDENVLPLQDSTEPIVRDEENAPIAEDATDRVSIVQDDIENAPSANDATESVQIAQDATESNQVSQDDDEPASVANDDIESEPIMHDATEAAPILQDATVSPLNYNAESVDDEAIQNDAVASESDAVTHATILEDQPSQDATVSNLISHDDNEVTESNLVSHDEAPQNDESSQDEVTERVLQDEVVDPLDEATVKPDIVQDDNLPISQSNLDDATERIQADAVNTEVPVANEEYDIVQDAPSTESSLKAEVVQPKDNEVFDILLDDEVVPEKLEILNQVRDVNEIEAEQQDTNQIVRISPSSVETLLEGVRHADNDTVEIINLSVVAPPEDPQHTEGSTNGPSEISADSNHIISNDEPNTDRPVELQQEIILNDEISHDASQTSTSENPIVNDGISVDATERANEEIDDEEINNDGLFRLDDTLFRTDIFRHHLGVPHDDETTTAAPIVPNDEPVNEVIASDEPQTTIEPAILSVKNKVQKVAEAVSVNKAPLPNSLEIPDNKFRLELDIFRGSGESLSKGVEVDTDVRTKVDESDAVNSDVSATTSAALQDLREVPVPTENTLQLNDDAVTEQDRFRDDATTPLAIADILQDGEGSGAGGLNAQDEQPELRQDIIIENDEAAATTSLPNLDEPEQNNEIAENDGVTTSYAFRMNLPNSLEDQELVEQQDAVGVTQSSIHNDVVEAETEGVQVLNDEVTEAPVIVADDIASQDEVATEQAPRLRNDLESSTELPPSNIVSDAEPIQNDYVEVSTTSPSGFAMEYREESVSNDDVVTASSNSNDEPEVQEDNVTPSIQQNELRSEPLEISAEGSNNQNILVNDEVNSTPVVFADEAITTSQPLERLRTEQVLIEQQTEAQPLQDDQQSDDTEVTTESILPNNNNQSVPIQEKAPKEEIILPERGLLKIQPISPDMSRNNNHELRFDFQLPPEKDNSWLSRAVNQFRRLAIFGNGNNPKPVAPTKTRMQNHRFLLF